MIYIYVRCKGYTAIHRRDAGDIWQGLYEPWLVEHVPSGAVLQCQNIKHILTHRIIYADLWVWDTDERPLNCGGELAAVFLIQRKGGDDFFVQHLVHEVQDGLVFHTITDNIEA